MHFPLPRHQLHGDKRMSVDPNERQFLFEVWNKIQANEKLDTTEKLMQKTFEMHPELHSILSNPEDFANHEYNIDEPDPFSHLALHAIVLEMISADTPNGLRSIYDQHVNQTGDKHAAQHDIMLAVFDWLVLASDDEKEPDGAHLLTLLRKNLDQQP